MGKQKKKRRKQAAWIKKQIKCKELQKWPDIQHLLSEIHLCYVTGANVAVHLLAPLVVERYLQKVFLKDKADQKLLHHMIERAQRDTEMKKDDIAFNIEVNLLRQERSEAWTLLEMGVQFLATQQNVQKKKYYQKEAHEVLKQLKQILGCSNKLK